MSTFESDEFEAILNYTNKLLRISGLQLDTQENNQTLLKRLWSRKYFWFFNIMLYAELLGEIAWFIKSVMEEKFIEVTYCAPCITLCLLGNAKSYYRIKYGHHINELIDTLRYLQSNHIEFGVQTIRGSLSTDREIRSIVRKLRLAIKILLIVNITAVVAFLLSPLFIMTFTYYTTGVMVLRFPLLILYPFDGYDLRVYPFVYGHQMVGAAFVVFSIFGPDCLYYILCTFVHVQFQKLSYNFETIIPSGASLRFQNVNVQYRKKLTACISRHEELIRCCNLIEITYSKSALFNFGSSSLLLCLAGFNIMAYEDLSMFSNFLSFLFMCLLQIYLICYYGDNVSRASSDLSSAVYNSLWYKLDAKSARDLFIIMARAQKPCKLTACTFTEINLGAFTRILSTSWSYFALLKSVYTRGDGH